MPTLELTDEELQGFVVLCATASGPGINWQLTNALLSKARMAQEASKAANLDVAATVKAVQAMPHGANSEDHDAAVPRA